MTPQEIHERLKAQFGEAILDFKADAVTEPWIRIAPDRMKEVGLFLRDTPELQFDYLMCLSGVDNNDGTLSTVYHLYSMAHKHRLILKAVATKDNPQTQSVESVWKAANWHERESFDLLGIIYTDHPDLRRILCPYDWEGHPLRKDYKLPEFYNGMKVPY
jgi:NADH-quinone oxidoreductase subunit C